MTMSQQIVSHVDDSQIDRNAYDDAFFADQATYERGIALLSDDDWAEVATEAMDFNPEDATIGYVQVLSARLAQLLGNANNAAAVGIKVEAPEQVNAYAAAWAARQQGCGYGGRGTGDRAPAEPRGAPAGEKGKGKGGKGHLFANPGAHEY